MAYEIPYDSNYGEWYGQPQDVTRLSAMLEQSLDEDGYPIGIITASWNMPDNGGTFVAQLSTDGTEYHIAETNITQNSVVLIVEPNTDYYLKIITVLGSQQSSGVVSSLLSSGVTIVPPTPTVVAVQGGMQINVGSVPFGYNAVISISDGTDTTVLYTTNMITIYNCDAGTYSVSTAYANASNDVGTSSSSASVTVSELATADDYVEKTSADYIKSASVNAGGDTLTLTKGDDTTVTFQGGGGGGGSYTAGDGIDITNDTISLETASTTDIGGVIVGSGLSIDANGVLSAIGGGGSGSGNASGVVREELWGNTSGWNSSTITLNKSWKEYDFLEFVGARPSESPTSSNPYVTENYLTVSQVKTQPIKYLLYNYDNRYMTVSFTSDTVLTAGNNSDFKIYNIYGIKFSKNLTEQMSSNVLYENASGWKSGTITLNDSLENYDFIQCDYGCDGDSAIYVNSCMFDAKLLLDGRLLCFAAYGQRFFNATVTSATVLTFNARVDYYLKKITGFKLAQGGYSGIVTDARMTVKSGHAVFPSKMNNNSGASLNIVFDSPMPDTNYYVLLTASYGGSGWANTQDKVANKTVNGFTITLWTQWGSTESPPEYEWIAIRPNSYTREGMVEDVLFSNASGVNSGTINLSGNISDYDFVVVDIWDGNNSDGGNSVTYLSSSILHPQSPKGIISTRYHESYIQWGTSNGNTINIIGSGQSVKIYKITGIKFGRYVSGVAVDTTVTQGSSNVVTSGAVYNYIASLEARIQALESQLS